jgi:hypothetical protein
MPARGATHHDDRAAAGGLRAQLLPNDEARQVAWQGLRCQPLEQRQRPGAECSGQQARAVQGLVDALVKGVFLQRALIGGQRARQDGVLAQQRIKLAGHVGAELFDAPRAYRHPFAVGAGQHQRGVVQAQLLQGAKDLNLLAAHDIRHTVVLAAQTRHDGQLPGPQPGQSAGHLVKAGRALAVRGFQPALPAANHAGHQGQRVTLQPARAECIEHRGKAVRRHRQDALGRGAFFQHLALRAQPCCTQRTGAPVDCDQWFHKRALTASGRGSGATAP